MAVHDWSRVEAGIIHHFHHSWIEELSRSLNRGVLPPEYYALAEQHAAGFGPDVLTLERTHREDDHTAEEPTTDQPLTLAAYESGPALRGYIEPISIGQTPPDMPLFLEFGAHVLVPLEATYERAFVELPRHIKASLVS